MEIEIKDALPYVVAILSGIGSFIASTKKAKQELKTLEEKNRHELEKLMKQHEIDIEALKEKHKLEMEKVASDHKNKFEMISLEHKNELSKKAQELELSAIQGILENPDKFSKMIDLVNSPKFRKFKQ
jgi:hypothetical protein